MLNGQVALVTGATAASAAPLPSNWAPGRHRVVGTSSERRRTDCRLGRRGRGQGPGLVLEVRDQAQVDGVIAGIDKEFGPVGILVNNAGITRDNLAMRMKDEEWDAVIETNLKAVFRLPRRSCAA